MRKATHVPSEVADPLKAQISDYPDRSGPLNDSNEQPIPPPQDRFEQLTTACDESTPELLRVRGMKFMYPSGSKPLEGFTIKRGIGIGGFGEVYFALSDAGKEVALKRILRNCDIELRGVRQCLNLKHSNLIALWDIRESGSGDCWVVMEYVPGISLRDAVNEHARGMPLDEVDRWFSSAAAGVAYLHERGIVHRDLKPGNIFQDDDEQIIKIGDYGLSKFISTSQRDNQTESVGTFHYMAPEIGKGIYGKEVDIYAMGIILHEMLTGRVPFDGESSQEIIMKHLTADPDLDIIPAPFRAVIRRALAKDPNKRYSSVEELVADLGFKQIPNSLHRRVKDLNSRSGRRIPPITTALDHSRSESTQKTNDPIIFIGDEIEFGQVHEIIEADSAIMSRGDKPVLVEQVEVIENTNYSTRGLSSEPIARAVHHGYQGFVDWWNNGNISTPLKVAIVGAGVLALIFNLELLLPLTLGLAFVYLVYYLVRIAFLPTSEGDFPRAQPAQVIVSGVRYPNASDGLAVNQRGRTRKEQAADLREELGQRRWSTRIAELSGSLVVATLACATFSLLGLAVGGNLTSPTTETWMFYTWLFLTSTFATWGILVVNKTWEHKEGDFGLRRFAMLSLGMLLGLASFGFAHAMNLSWNNQNSIELGTNLSFFEQAAFAPAGIPSLLCHLSFFATLFLLIRWWKNADPIRRSRLNLFGVGVCLIWAVILGQLFYFPQPWGMIIAVVVAAATQIASPWRGNQSPKLKAVA